MEPITLGKAIAEYGVSIITAVMLILTVGLVWYLIKRQTKREDKADEERTSKEEKRDEEQKEDRKYFRGLLTNDVKELHEDNKKNADLNNQSIILIKSMNNTLIKHNHHSEKFSEKVLESFNIVCERLNGGTEGTKAIEKLKELENKDRRKIDKKVSMEKRI